jgi:hypothetical protein
MSGLLGKYGMRLEDLGTCVCLAYGLRFSLLAVMKYQSFYQLQVNWSKHDIVLQTPL